MVSYRKNGCPVRKGFLLWLGLFCFFWQAGLTTLAWAGLIQDLITAAPDGGTVSIPAATIAENLNVDKNLTLLGVSSAASILQPGTVGERAITVSAGNNLTLQNLTVTGAHLTGKVGGGAYLAGGSLTLIGVHITNNSADYGGGIFQEGGSGRLEATNSLIEGNTAAIHGGGLYVQGSAILTNTQVASNTAGFHGGGLHVNTGSAEITGGTFSGNQATGGNGGGINVNNGLTVTGTQFLDNTAGDSGGALTQWNETQTVSINTTSFHNNSSKNKGGAAFVKSALTLTGSTFTNNTVDSAGAGNASGGAVHTESPATVTGSTFTGNQAKCTGCSFLNGGGLSIALPVSDRSAITVTDSNFEGNNGWFGGGLYAGYGTLNINRSTFRNNHAGYGAGLAAYILSGDHLLFQGNMAVNKGGGVSVWGATITKSRFISNLAAGGGGISAANGNLTVTNVLLTQNSASNLGGGALLIENLLATVTQATIAQPSRGSGSGIKVSTGASLTIRNTILADYATGLEVNGGTVTEDYNLFYNNGSSSATSNGGTMPPGGHSLTGLDPRLADPIGGDYHLTALSPAIGAGTNLGITTDLDERPRLNNRFDIGAYQFWTAIYLPLIRR